MARCETVRPGYPEINRSVSPSELEQEVDAFRSAGLTRLDREPMDVRLY
jgi:hypothetical protein